MENLASPILSEPTNLNLSSELQELCLKIDKFLLCLGKFINEKLNQNNNIGIISAFLNHFPLSSIKTYLLLKKENYDDPPEILLVPVIIENQRFVLVVFDFKNKTVTYFDSLKTVNCILFYNLKANVQQEFGVVFQDVSQHEINETINENPKAELANFHMCRIAEEICFNNGKNKLMKPFLIDAEVERMKNILILISDPNWNLQWIPTLQFNEMDLFRSQEWHKIPFTCIFAKPYDYYFPILTTFLMQYLEYLSIWEKSRVYGYKKITEISINWTEFNQLRSKNFIAATHRIKNFTFFKTLALNDQEILLKHFELPFILFERIFYSFNSINEKDMIFLQSGILINLKNVTHQNFTDVSTETEKAQKFLIIYWKKIMDEIRNFDLHLIEGMYIFFTLLWNIQYLDDPISKEGEAVIRRGRFLLNSEMQKFYGNDRIKCQRLFYLKDICQIIEDGAKACKDL